MYITEKTKRVVANNVNECINIINALNTNSDIGYRYIYEVTKQLDGIIQIIVIDSLETSIVLQICLLSEFDKIDSDFAILCDFVEDKNDSYALNDIITPKEFKMYRKDLESVEMFEKVRYKRIFKICTLYGKNLYLDLDHKQFVPGLCNNDIEFKFSIITEDIPFRDKTFGETFLKFLEKPFLKTKTRNPEMLFSNNGFKVAFNVSRQYYTKELYIDSLKMIINLLKEFVKIFEKEIDIKETVYKNKDYFWGYIASPRYFTKFSDNFKEYTIKPNLSGIKTKKLFEVMEMIEHEVKYSSRPKFVFKTLTKSKTIYIKIIDQKDNSIVFSDHLFNTDHNLKLIKNIKFVYRMFLTDEFTVKESIVEKVKKYVITSFSDQVSIGVNYISLGLFPFITKEKLPKLPNGWIFDLQQFIYKSNKIMLADELEKVASDFINWLGLNTKYFKEEAI